MVTTAAMLYEERTQEVKKQLERIAVLLDQHQQEADGRINYGHVGDVSYIRQELGDIVYFMEGKDD
jgi:hypothetical protein